MSTRRVFNTGERVGMFLSQDGRCASCGNELEPDWEADHVIPYSADGPTEDWNGQALCRSCNRKKGSRLDLWEWQHSALDHYFRGLLPDYLLVATPGAGKTRVASEIAGAWLRAGSVEQIVVVVPTTYLKGQWAEKFHVAGIPITPEFENRRGTYSSDYKGIVVTYAQVAEAPRIFEHLMVKPSLVVFDEIHHCGDQKSWGEAIRRAFVAGRRRLLLSGTPFRSDNDAIPFVRYVDGASAPSFTYGYGDALAAGIVRAIYFPLTETQARWISSRGEIREATFKDDLDEQGKQERLRTVLDPAGEWFAGVVRDAHQRLMKLREAYPDAGGLVIARDQPHAQAIGQLIERLTGFRPVVAISDEPDAQAAIRNFTTSAAPWIVAVRMVSEGIDIPRLRVGVYGTNVKAELFFNQAVGRIIRRTGDDDTSAWFYLPADPDLIELARRIEETREHVLDEENEKVLEAPTDGDVQAESSFLAIAASFEDGGAIAGEEKITPGELLNAKDLKAQIGQLASVPPELIALILRNAPRVPERTVESPGAPVHVRVQKLRKANANMVGRLAHKLNLDHRAANKALNERIGVYSVNLMTEEQLTRRLQLAEKWRTDGSL